MGIGEKIDINKGKLPYRGRGLENSVNIAACSIEEQRRFGLERLAAAFRFFLGKVSTLVLQAIYLLEIQSLKIISG